MAIVSLFLSFFPFAALLVNIAYVASLQITATAIDLRAIKCCGKESQFFGVWFIIPYFKVTEKIPDLDVVGF
jgi:hypothetical protein